ncbi:hypothetical protein [Rhodoblastus sp.]|uniref:hypothetical protein n=1 Tax=Rhodoblastus sp. TaxID=1962975 RepID=UPI003F96DC5C
MPGSLPPCFHAPNRNFEVVHLKSRNGPNVRAIECNHHWATLDAAYPMRGGIIEGLQTIRGPGETTPEARMVSGLARWQQNAHHLGGLSERQSGAEFGLNAYKLMCGSPSDQLRCPA